MTEFLDGGQRRIDRLLAQGFLEEALGAADEELLRYRDAAVQEEADLSYVRRLLQGRLDLLAFEQDRRAGRRSGERPLGELHDDGELARALARVLCAGRSRGPAAAAAVAHEVVGEPVAASEGRRAAESAASDVQMSDVGHLDDDALAAAVDRLAALETQVSASRHQVQAIADALEAEVSRRVELGLVPADRIQPQP